MTPARVKLSAVSLLALIVTPALAMQNEPGDATNLSALIPSTVIAFDQKLNGDTVTIKYVHLPVDGYVALKKADAEGEPTKDVLGYVHLARGDHRDVKVEIKGAKAGDHVWAAPYQDVDGDKKLDLSKDTSLRPDGVPTEGRFEILG